jgi:lysophospholipase L1-like esterase
MAPQDSTIVRGSIQRIAETAENLGARGVHLLVVAFPQHPGYRDMGQYGRYGPSLAMFARVKGWFAEIEEANPYFHFYDGNMDGLHGLDSTDFWDCNHLSASGAQKFGARVDSVIATLGLP